MKLNIKDSFTMNLIADELENNFRRQVKGAHFSFVSPRAPSNPTLIHTSENMMNELGLTPNEISSNDFLNMVSGKVLPKEMNPFAMCYGGHQFGHWAGQLGDGRAINLGEVIHNNASWSLQLKGSGETPYSRSADGLAVLRSSIREHLCSEAMYHLGVPTTRSLSLCLSGDEVLRDVMYDGNPAYEKGAIVCRVSPSFIRFGSFEIFSARKDVPNLKLLTDYTIKQFFPSIQSKGVQSYIDFFQEVSRRTLDMIVHWQRVGFVHGVMNTDNLSILGLTIDYGPYGWLEGYDNNWTPNTTDKQNRRYRFGNQAPIALWNLYQLANALYPLINDVKPLEEVLDRFKSIFIVERLNMLKSKFGFYQEHEGDEDLVNKLENLLSLIETDMTLFFRLLADVNAEDDSSLVFSKLNKAFYNPEKLKGDIEKQWKEGIDQYLLRLQKEKIENQERKTKMNKVNPKYVLRNYMAQLAIDDADKGDYNLINELYLLLKKPYDDQPQYEKWFAKRPEWARHKVGCSMLSCSS